MNKDFKIEVFGDRWICLKGVGKLFYQEGFPISMASAELKKRNIEISFLHMIEEFWDNGWSWKTIEIKLRGELEEDIDKSLDFDFEYLKNFYDCLEQPQRSNGGYEKSREMIFQYLFRTTTEDARSGRNINPIIWAESRISH